jgi:hypothetical protein
MALRRRKHERRIPVAIRFVHVRANGDQLDDTIRLSAKRSVLQRFAESAVARCALAQLAIGIRGHIQPPKEVSFRINFMRRSSSPRGSPAPNFYIFYLAPLLDQLAHRPVGKVLY